MSKVTRKELIEATEQVKEDITLESLGLVRCEHTKLWGKKEDMVEKSLIYKDLRGCGQMAGEYITQKTVYYSPAFAPEWDVKDITGSKVKYFKNMVEIKVKE